MIQDMGNENQTSTLINKESVTGQSSFLPTEESVPRVSVASPVLEALRSHIEKWYPELVEDVA